MSWLRNHVRHFVVPGIRALARADGKPLLESQLKPFDGQVRPASGCRYQEAGLLYAVISSVLPKENETRQLALTICKTLGLPNDSKLVYQLDNQKRVAELGQGYKEIEGADVLHSFIRSSVRALKQRAPQGGFVVYPGRDVWCWEVLSRKAGLPSVYDSRFSRSIAEHQPASKAALRNWGPRDFSRMLVFDTGYSGTVPRAIGKAAGLDRVNMVMLSAEKVDDQLFPGHAKARRKALAFEYLAKYHKRGVVGNDEEPYQELADLEEFVKAALLTIWLWYHVSPSRVPPWRDKPVESLWPKDLLSRKHTNMPIVRLPAAGVSKIRPVFSSVGIPIWDSNTSSTTTNSWLNMDNGAGSWALTNVSPNKQGPALTLSSWNLQGTTSASTIPPFTWF